LTRVAKDRIVDLDTRRELKVRETLVGFGVWHEMV